MRIKRPYYLNKLISKKHNSLIKVVTGIRRCGKSYLLFELFREHLIQEGIAPEQIIEIVLDDRRNKMLRNPDECLNYVVEKVKDNKQYYVLIDEVQMMDEFEDVLNSFLHIKNVDVYATGSNSKFLATDIITEFRGRSDEIHVNPLTFKEFYSIKSNQSFEQAWEEYIVYGGLPYVASLTSFEDKEQYLKKLFTETYIKDILERNKLKDTTQFEELLNVISSSIGSLTNPKKLSNTFQSVSQIKISEPTIKNYLNLLEEAYMIEKALRYDIKGKKYINTPAKYYFSDIGLRNARLNFRQIEPTHIMENIIYNELRSRGFSVDIGLVEVNEKQLDGTYSRKKVEVDFVVNKGSQRCYIQSAYALPIDEKKIQEERPFYHIKDSFKKIIIVKEDIILKRDDMGIITIGLKDFLLNYHDLEF